MDTPGLAGGETGDVGALLRIAQVVRRRNLRDEVGEALRSAIGSGALEKGTVYPTSVLTAAFGVSATPVREAMTGLSREGLVEVVKNRGFRILGLSRQDLDHDMEICLLLEPPSMRRVVGNIPLQAYNELREQADRTKWAAEAGSKTDFLSADHEFHHGLLKYSGNIQLVELLSALRKRARIHGAAALISSHRMVHAAREHHMIVDSLQAGDGLAAQDMMFRHISHAN